MTTQPNVVVVTGASSGFGNLTARALAEAGHIVYAGMRATADRNAPAVAALAQFKKDRGVQITAVEMDVQEQVSIDAAIDHVMTEQERIDVVVHNAGHMVLGPAEAFTAAQLADVYDVNVLSTQRVNRTVLPIMRRRQRGLLVWVGSSSTALSCSAGVRFLSGVNAGASTEDSDDRGPGPHFPGRT